ncbi:MAG: hypothetical protein ACI822_000835 [Gammaproteobacteria bacterium]|jgi:hypothetical protein
MNFKSILIALFCAFVVSACGGGGGGGGGSVSNATIDSANAEKLGIAATEGVKTAALVDLSAGLGFRSSAGVDLRTLNETLASRIAARTDNLSTILCTGTGGGTAILDTDDTGSGTFVITNCDLGGGLVINGTMTISVVQGSTTTSVAVNFNNFTVTDGSETNTFSFSSNCTVNNSTSATTCTYSSSVAGIDGRSYTVSGASVTGNDSSGYTVSATVIDPDHGRLTISTVTPVKFNCPDNQPSSGEIQFTDDAGVVVTVTYNDCATFTVSYSGTSTIYNW